jgi:RNA polymerase sigma-70 factor (ECF subfamily)
MQSDPGSLSLASIVEVPGASTPARYLSTAAATALTECALKRAQTGEIEAFRELVHAHQGSIYSLALRLLNVREDAQELAQDVFMLLNRHLADIVSAQHLRFWLRRTVCHRAIDRLRRPRLAVVPLDAATDLELPAREHDSLMEGRLGQLIARLPVVPRAVLLLRYQEDLDPPEIAQALGLPLNTVKSHLRRSLALLRSRSGVLQGPKVGEKRT